MKNALMGKALKAKLGNGINLTIMLGDQDDEGGEAEKETKDLGLAPSGASSPNAEQDEKDVATAKMTHQMPDEGAMSEDAGEPQESPEMLDAVKDQSMQEKLKKMQDMLPLGLGKKSLTSRAMQGMKKG